MTRNPRNIVWTTALLLCAALRAGAQSAATMTCDAARLNADSYWLTTGAQAAIVTEDRSAWWERFSIAKAAGDLRDLNWGSLFAAERAREIDPNNLLAHA